jgi:WD40 repeat protein
MEQQQRQHAAQLMYTCHDRHQRAEGSSYGFYVLSVAWSPDGSKIVNAAALEGNGYPDVHVWSSRSGSTLLTLTGYRERVIAVAWSPYGSKIGDSPLHLKTALRAYGAAAAAARCQA